MLTEFRHETISSLVYINKSMCGCVLNGNILNIQKFFNINVISQVYELSGRSAVSLFNCPEDQRQIQALVTGLNALAALSWRRYPSSADVTLHCFGVRMACLAADSSDFSLLQHFSGEMGYNNTFSHLQCACHNFLC